MPHDTLVDYITGETVPDVGAEANRQALERFLVERIGYLKSDIAVGLEVVLEVGERPYRSAVDLVVSVPRSDRDGDSVQIMAIKCAAGSLGSREREVLSAARLVNSAYQIPFAVASDGATAIVLDTLTGKNRGEGLEAIPSRQAAIGLLDTLLFQPLPADRREREKLIFRSYDSQNINRM
jgi:hypothetical protein